MTNSSLESDTNDPYACKYKYNKQDDNTQELKLMSMNLAMHNYRVYDNKTQANKMITILTFAQFSGKGHHSLQ